LPVLIADDVFHFEQNELVADRVPCGDYIRSSKQEPDFVYDHSRKHKATRQDIKMKIYLRHALQLGICSFVLAGSACSQDVAEPAEEKASPAVENETASFGKELDQKVATAIADLAAQVGVAEDAITVREARIVNWGSSAVGCPREDMNYTQAIVPGVLLLLEVNGKIYRYHGGSRSELFHCPDDRAEAPAYGSGEEFM